MEGIAKNNENRVTDNTEVNVSEETSNAADDSAKSSNLGYSGQQNNRRRWHRSRKQPRVCYFCAMGIYSIDYKDVELLNKYINNYCKIMPRRQTWCCNKHQGYLTNAIKRARIVGLLPFIKVEQ